VADHHLTGDATMIIKGISAVIHETANLQNPGHARNAVWLMPKISWRTGSSRRSAPRRAIENLRAAARFLASDHLPKQTALTATLVIAERDKR
jgi:hypothetical protein